MTEEQKNSRIEEQKNVRTVEDKNMRGLDAKGVGGPESENIQQAQAELEDKQLNLIDLLVKEKSEALFPPVGYTVRLAQYIYRVSYINAGKLRFTCEYLGAFIDATRVRHRDGRTITVADLDAEIRKEQPKSHEAGRNPANTTLDVKPGVLGGGSKFKGKG